MDILLTGASGFIGSNFHQHYKDRYNIICIDKLEGQDLLTCNLPSVDLVIHLAGLSGVRQSFDNPTDYWKQNVIVSQKRDITLNLLFDPEHNLEDRILNEQFVP